jgi:two-component system sensor histidine kinase ChiS
MNSKKWIPYSNLGPLPTWALFFFLALLFSAHLFGQAEEPVYQIGSTPILLTGQWMRYPGYIDEAAADTTPAPRNIHIGLRDGLIPGPSSSPEAVSYRFVLKVAGPAQKKLYGLTIPGLQRYRSLSVNGEVLYDRAVQAGGPSTLFFHSSSDRFSIILQSPPGGPRLESSGPILAAPFFGEAGAIDARRALLAGIVFVEIAFFAVGGFFMLFLFGFWKKNKEFLAFALFLIMSAIFYLFKFSSVFPGLSSLLGSFASEIGYALAFALLMSCFALFFYSLFGAKLKRYTGRILVILPLFFAAAVLLLPDYFSTVYALEVAYSGLFALLFLIFIFIALFKGNHNARWLAPAALPWVASMLCSALFRDSLRSVFLFEPAGHMIFAFVAWLMLVKKVGDTFESVETLSDYVATVSTTVRKFIPKEFLEALDKTDVVDLKLGDHVRREMTIFFSDIRAFTELSEKLTVEENFAFINSYLSRVVPIVKENGGFVDKYIGDAIMALFPGPKGPDEAIRAAIAMQGKIVEYNGHRAKMGYRPISMGVGVHSGDLMLGVVGVSDRMENTVISDAVNLASRLQAITKAFNISLAISEQAFKELEDPGSYKYRFIGKVRVKGKSAPVSVFEIFDGIAPDLFERKMKANMFFEQGMLSYYQKDFAGAMYYFKRVFDIIPEDGAASFYLDNCLNKAAL